MRRPGFEAALYRLSSVVIVTAPFIALLTILGVGYLLRWTELSEEIDEHKMKIERVGWIATNAKRLALELAAADRSMSSNSALYVGDPDSAESDLQSDVKALLDSAAMQIASIQPVAIDKENGISLISVRAQASGPYPKVLSFLQAAHSSTPIILIVALDLMPDPAQQSSAVDTASVSYVVQFEAVRLMAAGQ
jgi:hypothetical protein